MERIHQLKEELTDHLKERFGITPEKTTLHLYNTEEWEDFCLGLGFNRLTGKFSLDSHEWETMVPDMIQRTGIFLEEMAPRLAPFPLGRYMPRDLSAHVHLKKENSTQTFFHEYFGHGLYAEHTAQGQETHLLEQALLEEEKQAGVKSLRAARELGLRSETGRKLKTAYECTLAQNEGFATWMQWHLSRQAGILSQFETHMRYRPTAMKAVQKLIDYSNEHGEHALLQHCGFTAKEEK